MGVSLGAGVVSPQRCSSDGMSGSDAVVVVAAAAAARSSASR